MALTNATVAAPDADSLVDVEAFKLYITNNRPDKASLLLLSDDILSAYLRQASAIFNTLLWRGNSIRHSVLFTDATITITNNVITFDDISSFIDIGLYPSEITGDSFYTYRTTGEDYSLYPLRMPYWLKLIGCAEASNDGFIYPYSVDDSSIINDVRFRRLVNETSTTGVTVWLEAYAEGSYEGFLQSQAFPRRNIGVQNATNHEIPQTIVTALCEMAVFQSEGNLVANNGGISNKDLSKLDLGGELVVEFDRAQSSKASSMAALVSPIPDSIMTMILPFLIRQPGIESNSGVSQAIRV